MTDTPKAPANAETSDSEVRAMKDAIGAISKRLDALTRGRKDDDDDDRKDEDEDNGGGGPSLTDEQLQAIAAAVAQHLGIGRDGAKKDFLDLSLFNRQQTMDAKDKPHAMASDARADAIRRQDEIDAEKNAIAEAQQEWATVAQMHGVAPLRPAYGESSLDFNLRAARKFQSHSEKWKDADLKQLPPINQSIACGEVRADAMQAAYRELPNTPGQLLREVRTPDITGRIHTKFFGPVLADNGMIAPFAPPLMWIKKFDRNAGRQ